MKKKIVAAILMAIACAGVAQCKANEATTVGKFYDTFEAADDKGNVNTYYQFKSNDDAVWWALTEAEMGFVPNGNAEYVITYDNNGTTKENKPCDCTTECECEVYDDIFTKISEVKGK